MNKEQPISTTDAYGKKTWELNNRYHKPGGPAVEYSNGDCSWYLNGKRHRLDGPAMDWPSYSENPQYEWFIHDHRIRLTKLELSVGLSIPWSDDVALIINQINHTLFQVLIGNKKQYLFSLYNTKYIDVRIDPNMSISPVNNP